MGLLGCIVSLAHVPWASGKAGVRSYFMDSSNLVSVDAYASSSTCISSDFHFKYALCSSLPLRVRLQRNLPAVGDHLGGTERRHLGALGGVLCPGHHAAVQVSGGSDRMATGWSQGLGMRSSHGHRVEPGLGMRSSHGHRVEPGTGYETVPRPQGGTGTGYETVPRPQGGTGDWV